MAYNVLQNKIKGTYTKKKIKQIDEQLHWLSTFQLNSTIQNKIFSSASFLLASRIAYNVLQNKKKIRIRRKRLNKLMNK